MWTSKPANSIVGSVPGTPITPELIVITATPASPSESMTLVANVTSGPVSEATSRGTGASVATAGPSPNSRLGFPHRRGHLPLRYCATLAAAARDDSGTHQRGDRRRALRPRSRGRGLRDGARRLSWG